MAMKVRWAKEVAEGPEEYGQEDRDEAGVDEILEAESLKLVEAQVDKINYAQKWRRPEQQRHIILLRMLEAKQTTFSRADLVAGSVGRTNSAGVSQEVGRCERGESRTRSESIGGRTAVPSACGEFMMVWDSEKTSEDLAEGCSRAVQSFHCQSNPLTKQALYSGRGRSCSGNSAGSCSHETTTNKWTNRFAHGQVPRPKSSYTAEDQIATFALVMIEVTGFSDLCDSGKQVSETQV